MGETPIDLHMYGKLVKNDKGAIWQNFSPHDVERDNARKEQSKTASSDLEVGCVCREGINEKFLHNRNLNRAADHSVLLLPVPGTVPVCTVPGTRPRHICLKVGLSF